MPDSDTMPPEQPVNKSPLHKPLHELTEDDISQLTREDCRRYLKEKGMRRPSWNKSQAIQQVIMLKKLLEPPPNKKQHIPPPNNNINIPNFVPNRATVALSRPVDDTMTIKEKNPGKFGSSGELASRIATEDDGSLLRIKDVPEMPLGQMTIFYCGKVNVYDDVPAGKAQVIMHLAASPPHLPQDALYDETMVVQSSACQMQVVSERTGSGSNSMLLPSPQPVEGPGSRQASVQRYLEKRKDRFKSKRKVENTSSVGLDIYYNHQMVNMLNRQPNKGGEARSLPQIRPPNTPMSLPENLSSYFSRPQHKD